MQVTYTGFDNESHCAIARNSFELVSVFIPSWCRRLEIREGWEPENTQTLALVSSDDTYLKVTVTLYPKWFSLSIAEQIHSLRHELIDATMLPIINVVEDFLGQFITDKNMLGVGMRMMQREKEKATESINMVIDDLFPYTS